MSSGAEPEPLTETVPEGGRLLLFHAMWARLPDVIRRVWPILLIGLGARLTLAPISLNTDLTVFAQSSAAMLYGQGPYTHPTVYPPLWIFYLNAVGRVTSLFVPGPQWLSSTPQLQTLFLASHTLTPEYTLTAAYILIEKSSLIVFDLATACLLYHIAVRQTGKKRLGVTVFALWFLNPYVIILTSVHGSYDIIPAFCALAALFLALEQQPLYSGLAVAVGILIGIFPALLVPLLVAVVWRTARRTMSSPRQSLLRFLGGAAVPAAAILAVPGLLSSYYASVVVGPSRGGGVYQGFGFWGVFWVPGLNAADGWLSNLPGTLTVVAFATVAVVVGVILAVHFLRRESTESAEGRFWVLAAAATTMGAFLIPETVQPQYMVWVLPFLALLALSARRYLVIYFVFSTIPAVFYFVLAGPLLNFLPLWYQYHMLTYTQVHSSVTYWVSVQKTTLPLIFIPAFLCTTTLTVLLVRDLLRRRSDAAGSGGSAT